MLARMRGRDNVVVLKRRAKLPGRVGQCPNLEFLGPHLCIQPRVVESHRRVGGKGLQQAHFASREPVATPREEAKYAENLVPTRQGDPGERHETLVAGQARLTRSGF